MVLVACVHTWEAFAVHQLGPNGLGSCRSHGSAACYRAIIDQSVVYAGSTKPDLQWLFRHLGTGSWRVMGMFVERCVRGACSLV